MKKSALSWRGRDNMASNSIYFTRGCNPLITTDSIRPDDWKNRTIIPESEFPNVSRKILSRHMVNSGPGYSSLITIIEKLLFPGTALS